VIKKKRRTSGLISGQEDSLGGQGYFSDRIEIELHVIIPFYKKPGIVMKFPLWFQGAEILMRKGKR